MQAGIGNIRLYQSIWKIFKQIKPNYFDYPLHNGSLWLKIHLNVKVYLMGELPPSYKKVNVFFY